MDAVDVILDGLAAELELERELGVREVECDRTLLAGAGCPTLDSRLSPRTSDVRSSPPSNQSVTESRPPENSGARAPGPSGASSLPDFVFLHDRPLSSRGVEMMAKIVLALGKTAETAPVIVAPPVPQAKVRVVLGGLALRRYFPGLTGAPGQWVRAKDGGDVLVTYSPEYILRFDASLPAVKKLKAEMWLSLKSVLHRVASAS